MIADLFLDGIVSIWQSKVTVISPVSGTVIATSSHWAPISEVSDTLLAISSGLWSNTLSDCISLINTAVSSAATGGAMPIHHLLGPGSTSGVQRQSEYHSLVRIEASARDIL